MSASGPILGAFVSPGLFYAGAGAVSIPIIIHLLARRRFKRIRWAAVDFLIQAEKKNRRRINLQQLILLILRCLIIFLLGLMLARPFLGAGDLAGWLGAESRIHRVLLMDDSFSMGYTSSASSTFDQGKSGLLAILEDLHTRAPGGPVTILKASDLDAPVIRVPELNTDTLRRIREALQRQEPSSSAPDFSRVLARLNTMLLGDPDELNVALYIFSDFQKQDWLSGTEGSPDSPLNTFKEWPEDERTLALTLVLPVREPRGNLAVTRLQSAQAPIVATIENEMSAVIHNFTDQPSEPFEMEVFLEDASLPTVKVPAISPGGSTEVPFRLTVPVQGHQGIHVRIPADGLTLDNERFAAIEVQSAISVLLVNGEPDVSALKDEVALLETAFRPEGEVYSGFQVTVVDEAQVDGVDFKTYDVVVLANVYRISDETADRLEEFVAAGHGLAVFAGDQIDAALYNDRLFKDGEGLLPCRIADRIVVNRGGTLSLQTVDAAHPIVRIFSGEENPFISGLSFTSYFECIPDRGGEDHDGNEDSRVIAAFTDARQHAAILEKRHGDGRVVLFTSSADLEWNNWGKQPSYVVVMQELGQYLAPEKHDSPETLVGGTIRLTLDAERYLPKANMRSPAYPVSPQTPLQLLPSDDALSLQWSDTDQTGLYRLILEDHTGSEEEMTLAVNTDPRESNLKSCTHGELQNAAPDLEFSFVTGPDTLVGPSMEGQQEFWPALLVAVLLTLMVEQSLACWFGRSR